MIHEYFQEKKTNKAYDWSNLLHSYWLNLKQINICKVTWNFFTLEELQIWLNSLYWNALKGSKK